MDVTVVPIAESSRALLAGAPGWRETSVARGKRIARHSHDFQAFYYTFGVPTMLVGDTVRPLPPAAMVVVPQGIVHGWVGPESEDHGVVGHFHEGHGYHFTESADDQIPLSA